MPSKKCHQCGLVNFVYASNCKRCNADLSTELPREESTTAEQSSRSNSIGIYFRAIGVGLLLEVAFFIFKVMGYPNGRSIWFVVIFGVIYAVAAACLSAWRQVKDWLLALSLSLFYLLGLGLSLSQLLKYNQKYGGMFWSNKFYLSPILLFISIPLAVFFGTRFGLKRSLRRLAALISVFIVTSATVPFAEMKPRPAKELNYSTEIVAPEFTMRLELEFYLQVTDDPMNFRTASTPAPVNRRGGWNVTIVRKDYRFSPDIHMTMNIDGRELESSMWPINSPGGGSHIDFSQKQDYREIVNWSIGPNPDLMSSLLNAHNITMTWGNMEVVLPDEQVVALRTFFRAFVRMLHDEDVLCTNPMCQQGALNPKQ